MKQETQNIKLATAYLLAEMSEAERDAFEERLFRDAGLSDGVADLENDLIDDYLSGQLTGAERSRFETRFMVSERRRDKLAAASVLHRELSGKQSPSDAPVAAGSFWNRLGLSIFPPAPVFAGSAAILLILVAIFVLTRQPAERDTALDSRSNTLPPAPGSPLPQSSAENANTTFQVIPDNTSAAGPSGDQERDKIRLENVNRKQPPSRGNVRPVGAAPAPVGVFAFTLFPVTRSSSRPEFVVPAGAEMVRIRVVHNNEEPFVKYRVELRNSEGDTVWSRDIANKAASRSLSVGLPATLLPAGPHEVALLGVDREGQYTETNFYNFSVTRK